MTAMFNRRFQAQPTPSPALHNGTLRWDDIVNCTFDDFRRHHADLHVTYGDGDRLDTLEVLWQAMRKSPHRDRVHSELNTLIVDPHHHPLLPSPNLQTSCIPSPGTPPGVPRGFNVSTSKVGPRQLLSRKRTTAWRRCGHINTHPTPGSGSG